MARLLQGSIYDSNFINIADDIFGSMPGRLTRKDFFRFNVHTGGIIGTIGHNLVTLPKERIHL